MFKNLFTPKIETVGTVSDFLQGKTAKEVITPSIAAISLTTGLLSYTPMVGAEGLVKQHVAEKIIVAFDPVVQLIQGLAYPVGMTMICAGFLIMITGNRHKGLSMIKWAAIGFIGMQFAPAIMMILGEVGRAMMAK